MPDHFLSKPCGGPKRLKPASPFPSRQPSRSLDALRTAMHLVNLRLNATSIEREQAARALHDILAARAGRGMARKDFQ